MTDSALIYSEVPELLLELVSAAKSLGLTEIAAASLGEGSTQTLSVEGISRIFVAKNVDALNNSGPEAVVDALEEISKKTDPKIILIAATRRGREIAPRLATRLKRGCIIDALKLKLEGDKISADRLVWGGNAIARVSSNVRGSVVTVPLRSFEKATGSANPEIVTVEFSPKTRSSRVAERKEKAKGAVNIKDASAIVSAGRGFKKKEDLKILDDLAAVLNAVVAASRPLTSDLGWMPEDRQVGLSGVTVKPKLYVAVGISGQIQHLTGMRESKTIVAINTDKNAPIFQECDYGIIGDLYSVVPELSKDLKLKLGR
jgi:electron transfer flavoprotein alpha subunit